ncbi:MAG: DEAD/DEAH box helicase [Saprospiraceae bacterium]
MTFKELHLIPHILKALDAQGYEQPTPIQEQSIPIVLRGKDLLACAQTGTGKTAAFSIPIIQNIFLNSMGDDSNEHKLKALILTPTRELAIQIDESITNYSKFTNIENTVVFGGVKQGKQVKALRRGVDILVATPGRLLDLMRQGHISFRDLEYFVLDEADQMLDMGFIHDIRSIIGELPKERQSLFFSATMPDSIVSLSRTILGNFQTVTIKPEQPTAERVEQKLYLVNRRNKINLLVYILETFEPKSVLVFSRTKHGADKIVKMLREDKISAEAIHGDKNQKKRQKALDIFKSGKIQILVATDIAARGIDVSNLELVVNYDLPDEAETYVHRIGRTGRANASGLAISFCTSEDVDNLRSIETLIKQKIKVDNDQPYIDDGSDYLELHVSSEQRDRRPRSSRNRNGRNNNNRRRR